MSTTCLRLDNLDDTTVLERIWAFCEITVKQSHLCDGEGENHQCGIRDQSMVDSFTDTLGNKIALGHVKFNSFRRLIFLSVQEEKSADMDTAAKKGG